MRHTPTPWVIDDSVASHIRQPASSKRRKIVCPSDTYGEADAEFIVRAVNSYEELCAENARLRDQVRRMLRRMEEFGWKLEKALRGTE
jgi:hypothetical protein